MAKKQIAFVGLLLLGIFSIAPISAKSKNNLSYYGDLVQGSQTSSTSVSNQVVRNSNPYVLEIEAVGIGTAPMETCSPAQAVALAKRAAIIDAYRQLGEQMYGVQISATDSVRDMMIKNSDIRTKINAVIRGAHIKDSSCKQGICQVNMSVRLDSRIWSQIFGI